MKWNDTTASRCRYGDVASRIFDCADVIYEHSIYDCQGYANVFAAMPNGTFVHYEWSYGSCSGCDEWEDRGLTDDQVEAEMRGAMTVLPDRATVTRYLRLDGEFANAKIPTANGPTNGSLANMIRGLTGEVGADFKAIGEAFLVWCGEHDDRHPQA